MVSLTSFQDDVTILDKVLGPQPPIKFSGMNRQMKEQIAAQIAFFLGKKQDKLERQGKVSLNYLCEVEFAKL